MTIQRRSRRMRPTFLRLLGAAASALAACGGSVSETPAGQASPDTGTPDAAQEAGDTGAPDSDSADGETSVDSFRPLGVDGCRVAADCSESGLTPCVSHGGAQDVGPCTAIQGECTSDGDCHSDGAVLICDVRPYSCPRGVKGCLPGCMGPADCAFGEACTAHHCVPIPCQSEAQCPTDFACDAGACARKTCTDDSPCSGYCVVGKCYSVPGSCATVTPP
jgi:hypothetical protein